ncbi:MAG: NAD(P)/FAD-dependent oxidoreductase [Planctomycetes bacterium]|nr:NAD(P)/FAD-dependent oxidoreductase [Planctomycetota bacterium]
MHCLDDAIIIGSGPNGLAAALTLAQAGWRVRILEAQARPGGALYSLETTLPGYVHDVGAAFFPFAHVSPAFQQFKLADAGLEWRGGVYESAHPALDGTCPTIARDVDRAARTFGNDGDAWRWFAGWQAQMGQRLGEMLLSPLWEIGPAWRLGFTNLLRLGIAGVRSAAAYAGSLFRSEAARRVIPALSLHGDIGPDDFGGAAIGVVLALLAAGDGFQVPVGGARSITLALIKRIEQLGGQLELGTRVEAIIVRQHRAVAVRTNAGDEIPFAKAVLADVGAPALYFHLLPDRCVSGWVRQSMREFRYGWGTFKMDWALAGPVPWCAEEARQSAVVHTGENMDDLRSFTAEARAGLLPTNPYLVIGQQSLLDATRAPAGGQTLWAYSHVPSQMRGGWDSHKEAFADRIEHRIESLAPGFRALIRGRAIVAPPDLERMNENLVGGDLGGGSAQFSHQFFWRPVFPYFRYRTPVEAVYLCSASALPGPGVHAACGFNAAQAALADQV